MSTPARQEEKPPESGKGRRSRRFPVVVAKRFDFFFFLDLLFFPILDYEIYLIVFELHEKQK